MLQVQQKTKQLIFGIPLTPNVDRTMVDNGKEPCFVLT